MPRDLPALFGDLVRLEIDLWDAVDGKLREEHDLPLTWFEPLEVVRRQGVVRVGDIAAALSITVGGVSKLVDRLEGARHVVRRPDPEDGRSSEIMLTPTGRRTLDAARRTQADELERLVGAALSDAAVERFRGVVRRLRSAVVAASEPVPARAV